MSPSTMTTFELRRKVDCLAEQMYFLRAQKKHFEDEIKAALKGYHSQDTYEHYKTLLKDRDQKMMEIAKIEKKYEESKKALVKKELAVEGEKEQGLVDVKKVVKKVLGFAFKK